MKKKAIVVALALIASVLVCMIPTEAKVALNGLVMNGGLSMNGLAVTMPTTGYDNDEIFSF